jgi:hypothetical protein
MFLTSPPPHGDPRARSGTLQLCSTSKQAGGGTNPETHWGKTRNPPGTPSRPVPGFPPDPHSCLPGTTVLTQTSEEMQSGRAGDCDRSQVRTRLLMLLAAHLSTHGTMINRSALCAAPAVTERDWPSGPDCCQTVLPIRAHSSVPRGTSLCAPANGRSGHPGATAFQVFRPGIGVASGRTARSRWVGS